MMSSDYTWDLSRPEASQELLERYDIQKAKTMIQASPRPIEFLDLERYGDFMRAYLDEVRLKQNVDWPNVDIAFPLIFGRNATGKFPIDGRHRLAKAFDEDALNVPFVCLTEEETESVRSGVSLD